MINWVVNKDGYEGQIDVDDMVHLKAAEGFDYRIQGRVTEVNSSKVKAEITGVFDWESGSQVTSGLGTILELPGTDIEFTHNHVHELIKA